MSSESRETLKRRTHRGTREITMRNRRKCRFWAEMKHWATLGYIRTAERGRQLSLVLPCRAGKSWIKHILWKAEFSVNATPWLLPDIPFDMIVAPQTNFSEQHGACHSWDKVRGWAHLVRSVGTTLMTSQSPAADWSVIKTPAYSCASLLPEKLETLTSYFLL